MKRLASRATWWHTLPHKSAPAIITPPASRGIPASPRSSSARSFAERTIDHMNLPIFLVVLPVGFISATYFPPDHPVLAALSTVNPLYHLAEGLRGLMLGVAARGRLGGLAVMVAVMLGVLVPLDMRLLRKRVLGD